MTSRDDRHRRAAARLHALTVALAAEVVARGGRLDGYADLTDDERVEAEHRARTFWRAHGLLIRSTIRETVGRSRRVGRPPSTEP
jgi:hypothetical protein